MLDYNSVVKDNLKELRKQMKLDFHNNCRGHNKEEDIEDYKVMLCFLIYNNALKDLADEVTKVYDSEKIKANVNVFWDAYDHIKNEPAFKNYEEIIDKKGK